MNFSFKRHTVWACWAFWSNLTLLEELLCFADEWYPKKQDTLQTSQSIGTLLQAYAIVSCSLVVGTSQRTHTQNIFLEKKFNRKLAEGKQRVERFSNVCTKSFGIAITSNFFFLLSVHLSLFALFLELRGFFPLYSLDLRLLPCSLAVCYHNT